MPSYAYRAYTEAGQRRDGRIEAEGTSAAEQPLGLEGLKIVELNPAPPRKTMADYFPSLYQISRADIILFTRQLATFVGAGVPMSRALGTIAQETASPLFKRVILAVLDDLERGQNVSEALAKHLRVIPALYSDLVRVAELTGNLEATLTELAGYLRRDLNTARRVQAAMIYPAVILVVATGVVIILVFFALPAFVRIFAEFRVELPLSTRILIGIVNFTRQWALIIAAVIITIAGAMVLALRTSRGIYAKDQLSIKAPILGPIVLSAVLNRFARTLAMVLKAGVPGPAGTPKRPVRRGLTLRESTAAMPSLAVIVPPVLRAFPAPTLAPPRHQQETTLDRMTPSDAEYIKSQPYLAAANYAHLSLGGYSFSTQVLHYNKNLNPNFAAGNADTGLQEIGRASCRERV